MARNFRGARSSTLNDIAQKMKTTNAPVIMKISDLEENPINEYLFGMDGLDRLEESIKVNGFKGAIGAFRLPNGKAEIFDGHKRVRAKKNIGDEEIPVALYDMPDNETDKRNALLYFNLAGRNAVVNDNPIYTARQIDYHRETLKMMEFKGEKRKELARTFGISESQVSKYEAILNLNEDLQKMAGEKQIGLDNISAISKLDEVKQEKLQQQLEEEQKRTGERVSNSTLSTMINVIKEESEERAEKPANVTTGSISNPEDIKETEMELNQESQEEVKIHNPENKTELPKSSVPDKKEKESALNSSEKLSERIQTMDNYKMYKKLSANAESVLSKGYEYGDKKEEIIESLKHIKSLIDDELDRLTEKSSS